MLIMKKYNKNKNKNKSKINKITKKYKIIIRIQMIINLIKKNQKKPLIINQLYRNKIKKKYNKNKIKL